jgi:aryl-alcohol dehydrogenase-like predicted oxidoreductase
MQPAVQTQFQAVQGELVDIPGTRLRVSRVALGTWAMGGWKWGGTDERAAIATIQAALHQGISVALWGARHPEQVAPALDVAHWSLNDADRQLIERIVNTAVVDPVGPEFMAPPTRPDNPG